MADAKLQRSSVMTKRPRSDVDDIRLNSYRDSSWALICCTKTRHASRKSHHCARITIGLICSSSSSMQSRETACHSSDRHHKTLTTTPTTKL